MCVPISTELHYVCEMCIFIYKCVYWYTPYACTCVYVYVVFLYINMFMSMFTQQPYHFAFNSCKLKANRHTYFLLMLFCHQLFWQVWQPLQNCQIEGDKCNLDKLIFVYLYMHVTVYIRCAVYTGIVQSTGYIWCIYTTPVLCLKSVVRMLREVIREGVSCQNWTLLEICPTHTHTRGLPWAPYLISSKYSCIFLQSYESPKNGYAELQYNSHNFIHYDI